MAMRKFLGVWLFALVTSLTLAQTPTISPALFRTTDPITVTYDVTGTSLANLTTAYAWVWIPGSFDSQWNVNPANSNTAKTDNAKFTKSLVEGKTLFTITFTPSTFFTQNISSATKIGILLKGNDWSNGQTADFVTDFWDGSFQIKLTEPALLPLFVNQNEVVTIKAETPVVATYSLYINDQLVDSQPSSTSYNYDHTITEASGQGNVRITATAGANTSEVSFQYLISSPSEEQVRPVGVIEGINYDNADPTKVTLCLLAPLKTSVYVLGDFTNWDVLGDYQMKRDGEFFWIELTGLTSGQEYAFQYLVDETIRVADPYSDKILDPDDLYISAATYPNLKPFPSKAVSTKWYENRLSVFQTNQEPYQWTVTNFEKPKKETLVIYELLIRDFFDSQHRNYQSLIDTISYFKRLGITAIQLMPIMEFNGNEGWGYNPTFMFAPDKYYGTKNKFKEFIDVCHQNGIAVILDIAMNHQDVPNTYAAMYFDFETFKPAANNPWFNVTAKHPFNVFNDMNHESSYTKEYLDTVNHYWLNEYKIDGFRFDLSKGFTQTDNPDNVGAWSAYDASRVALLKRMADVIWSHTPDAYVTLEHLSANNEEKELAEYRADEGKGMMLWGKMTDQYNQNTMGFSESSGIDGAYHKTRDWTVPHLITYMESHDEERLMYKNINFGNSNSSYSTKTISTALERIEAANALFLTLPGPKMIWQFGEYGYDKSINLCENGTINNDCRLSPKPVLWEYLDEPAREKLFLKVADLNRLRQDYTVFHKGEVTFSSASSLVKSIQLKNTPYTSTPVDSSQMNVVIAANFDLIQRPTSITFPHTGTWYDYTGGGREIQVTQTSFSLTLRPGQHMLLTDVPIQVNLVTSVEEESLESFSVYPNPSNGLIMLDVDSRISTIEIIDAMGHAVPFEKRGENTLQIQASSGMYILKVETAGKRITRKVIIQ